MYLLVFLTAYVLK